MSQPIKDRLNYHSTHKNTLLRRPGRLVEQRLKQIQRNINLKGKTVLDLGCSGGYFSINLAKDAKQVVGVDADKEIIHQNKELVRRLGINNVEFFHAALTPKYIKSLPEYDVVLFLSVFHHMLATSDAYSWNSNKSSEEAFEALLAIRKKARMLVFEMGYPDEGYDWSSKLSFMSPDPVSWVMSNIFGDEFTVEVLPPPALRGVIGWVRRLALYKSKNNGLFWRGIRRLFHVDVRDKRHLYIGIRRV